MKQCNSSGGTGYEHTRTPNAAHRTQICVLFNFGFVTMLLLTFARPAATATLTPAANHKTVNNIVFNLLLYDTLQTGDLTTLESIAESCPFEGGDAVYEARAIVAYYTGQEYDDYVICAVAERNQKVHRKNAGEVSEEIIVYPNPSTGEVFFSTTDVLLVRVFSSIGQLQLEKTVNDGRLNLAHLPPGLYRFQIFRDGQVPITHSVILLNR